MADFEKDVEALDRVLFRLASATDERMLDVLQSLLPQLLKLFPTDLTAPSAAQLKDKVRGRRASFLVMWVVRLARFFSVLTACVSIGEQILQVVSHVKTRLQALPSPTLPLQALGALLRETDLSVFTHNFAFMFIGTTSYNCCCELLVAFRLCARVLMACLLVLSLVPQRSVSARRHRMSVVRCSRRSSRRLKSTRLRSKRSSSVC